MGNLLDIVFLVLLFGSTLSGLRRGFIRSVAEFVGSVLSLLASFFLSRLAINFLAGFLLESNKLTSTEYLFLRVLAPVIAFSALQALVHWAAGALEAVFRLPVLHTVNSFSGGVFGLLKGGVVVVLVCVLLQIGMPVLSGNAKWQKVAQVCASSRMYQVVKVYNPVQFLLKNVKLPLDLQDKVTEMTFV